MRCFFCDDPAAHPATGSQYTPRVLACRACAVRFAEWLVRHTNGKGRRKGPSFYDHVGRTNGDTKNPSVAEHTR